MPSSLVDAAPPRRDGPDFGSSQGVHRDEVEKLLIVLDSLHNLIYFVRLMDRSLGFLFIKHNSHVTLIQNSHQL